MTTSLPAAEMLVASAHRRLCALSPRWCASIGPEQEKKR